MTTSEPRRPTGAGRRPGRRLTGLGLVLLLALATAGCASERFPPKRTYSPNGNLEEEVRFDSEGRPHGLCRTWYDGGILRTRSVYDHGVLQQFEMWDSQGLKVRLPK